jgi:hypothetical protein
MPRRVMAEYQFNEREGKATTRDAMSKKTHVGKSISPKCDITFHAYGVAPG